MPQRAACALCVDIKSARRFQEATSDDDNDDDNDDDIEPAVMNTTLLLALSVVLLWALQKIVGFRKVLQSVK